MQLQLLIIFLIFFVAFLFVFSKPYTIYPNQFRKAYTILFMIVFILQSGLRNYGVGADTYTYKIMFEEDILMSWHQIFQNFHDVYVNNIGKDAGYALFEKIFSIFSSDYRLYLFYIAILFFSSFGYFLYKNTNTLFQVIFALLLYQALFYNFFSITGIRQTLATAITLFSFECIKNKKLVKFTALILLAAFLHKSALAFFPFYFIANIKNSKLIYTGAILLFPIIVIFKNEVAMLMALASSSEDYMYYVTSNEAQAGTPVFTGLILLIIIFGWIYIKSTLKNFPDSYRYYNAMALAFVFTPLTWVDSSLMRIVQYFSIFMLLFIPKIIESISDSKRIKNTIYAGMIVILIFLILKINVEYKFMWEYMPFTN